MRNINNKYLMHLNQQLIVFDGAMGTNLKELHLTPEHFGGEKFTECNDLLNITYPEAPLSVHQSFLKAGVDVIETNTFRANRITLAEYGLENKADEINRKGAEIARKIADQFSSKDHRRFVAGSMGPSGKLLSLHIENMGNPPPVFNEIRDVYRQQAKALISGGVDLLLIETAQDILEVKAAIAGIHDAFKETGKVLPIQAQVTLGTNGKMLIGTDIAAVVTILEGMRIDILGLNCSTGPKHMEPSIAYLSQHSHLPISCLPNAGLPINKDGKAVYPLSPDDFSDAMVSFVDKFNISTVGGCCGTTPDHLCMLVEKISKKARTKRTVYSIPSLSSAFHTVNLKQVPPPFIIGERLNTQGSRIFKRLMLENDLQNAIQIAKQQLEKGAHALDICTALTEIPGEESRTRELVRMVSSQIDLPLVIDSTDPAVMRAALHTAPGRCLLNSINLENGTRKAEDILELARQFNAAVIALLIDEKGMAVTTKRKLEIAERIYKLAVDKYSISPQSLVFDPLTFTLASGSRETIDAGRHTLEAIKQIKRIFPGVFTVLGISNISYGLGTSARKILNSIFLFHAVKDGLDLAIVNPAQITPYPAIPNEAKQLAEDLIFNRSGSALVDFINFFQSADIDQLESKEATIENLSAADRISRHILLRKRDNLEADIDAYILTDNQASQNARALDVLNKILLPAMKEIGDQFAGGELILPFVLQSAEIMRAASDHIETYLDKNTSNMKGKLVLATVYGDVHDIGKNLIKTIVSNNGYSVADLGKQVPAEIIIEKAKELDADAIGLSALLVSTSQQMPQVIRSLHQQGANIPVLIGGAPINQVFADQISKNEHGEIYPGGVHYCKDAFDALQVLESIVRARKKEIQTDLGSGNQKKQNKKMKERQPIIPLSSHHVSIPKLPFHGARKISLPLEDLFKEINRSALYRTSWGANNAKGEKWERFKSEFDARLTEMYEEQSVNQWLVPEVVYGFWQCNSEKDSLLVYPNTNDKTNEIIRFDLPRQKNDRFLCLSDYFAPVSSGKKDITAFQIVTMGTQAADHVHSLNENGDLLKSFFAHGLAVQLTETAARHTHNLIRQEMGIGVRQGKRYSWGYPAIPDLSQHKDIVRLLRAQEFVQIELTSAFQFVPEYSTAAIIVHHPQAVYFQLE